MRGTRGNNREFTSNVSQHLAESLRYKPMLHSLLPPIGLSIPSLDLNHLSFSKGMVTACEGNLGALQLSFDNPTRREIVMTP